MIAFLGRILSYARPYRVRLTLGLAFGILAGLASPALVIAMKLALGVVFPGPNAPLLTEQVQRAPAFARALVEGLQSWLPGASRNTVIVIAAITLIPLAMLLRGLLTYLNVYCMHWVAVRAVADLRCRLFDHLVNLSPGFFQNASTGDLMSRITNDTAALHGTIAQAIPVMINAPVAVIALAALLLLNHPGLTLISLVLFPACFIPIMIYGRKVRKASESIQRDFSELSSLMQESFTGNRIIKAYNLEESVRRSFRETSQSYVGHYMRAIRGLETPGPLIEFCGALGVAFILLYITLVTRSPARAAMEPKDFFEFLASIFLMYQPIKALTRLYGQLQQARASTQRVFELLATEITVPEPASPQPLRAAGADIRFDQLEFAYGDKTVLEGINLSVQAGQIVALVGASGSGKTTLTNLLLRFYDPQHGSVRIGDADIRKVSIRDLRSQIAVVTQETILFNDTIRNNIALGRPGANNGEIEEAAKHAFAHEFILEKPHGYDTVVGEKGVTLSGGQRQRIAIARAILKNAPILILDEAMSALDSESERAVQAALEELMQGRTTFCIAHRLSTVQKADLIVVLDQGRIVEAGRHTELIKRGGVYQKLYELQFQL